MGGGVDLLLRLAQQNAPVVDERVDVLIIVLSMNSETPAFSNQFKGPASGAPVDPRVALRQVERKNDLAT